VCRAPIPKEVKQEDKPLPLAPETLPEEDFFHENYLSQQGKILQSFSSESPSGGKKQPSSPGSISSSTAGSYSLFDFNNKKLHLSSLSLDELPASDNVFEQQSSSTAAHVGRLLEPNGENLVIGPPAAFADSPVASADKKASFKRNAKRAKSEERTALLQKSTQSSISLHESLQDLSTVEDDDSGKCKYIFLNFKYIRKFLHETKHKIHFYFDLCILICIFLVNK